jgi:hypothetical protein
MLFCGFFYSSTRKKSKINTEIQDIYIYHLNRDEELFSLTETDGKISLIVESEHLKHFPSGVLELEPHIWRALQLNLGALGYCK